MDCKAFRNEMEELERAEILSAAAQAHVDSCVACRTFQQERLSLRRLIGNLGTVNAPPDFDFRLRARLAAAKSMGNGAFRRTRFAPSLKAISAAASIVLLIAAAVAFKQFQSGHVNAPASSGNSTLVKEIDRQPLQTEKKPEQLAIAPPSEGVTADVSAPLIPTTGVVQAGGGTPKNTLVKAPRHALPAPNDRSPILSTEAAVLGNPPVIPVKSSAADRYATALLQVSSQPVKVLLQDRQGTTRSVSLKPIIFGSQDFLEQAAQRGNPALEGEGIW